jgi:hypothetical protein
MRLNGFFQTAYIVRDLEKACATFREKHGVGEFLIVDAEVDVKTIWGDGRQHMRAGLGWVDHIQIELIQPVSGIVRLYGDIPKDDTPRFHHVGMRVMDWGRCRAEIDANKWPVVSEGAVEGCNYIYIDARGTVGHYIEYIWMAPEWWAATGGPPPPTNI